MTILIDTQPRTGEPDWNDTEPESCLHERFRAQAERTPGATALTGPAGESWTYAELAARARRLASHLRSMGIGPEVPVGVAMPRTPSLVAALLGVLEAGGAYVPLDPDYPEERLAFLLEDTGAPVVLTETPLLSRLPDLSARGIRAVCLDDLPATPAIDEGQAQPPAAVTPRNLAYLIYTSGSTGRPKGVAIEHRSAVAFVHWARRSFSDEELAGVFAGTSINFDLSVFELFVPLCWGGRVILGENALALAGHPAAGEVTLLNTVPSAMAELVRMGAVPPSVRTVNLAGEPLRGALARQILALGTVGRLLDLYGPSEDTTYSTWAPVDPAEDREPTIGRPLEGTALYLLDHRGRPVPDGEAGEIWLGGAGLARGYFGRPDLTAERFLPDPFGSEPSEPGTRLYRTGDLARLLPDGRAEYIGRIDHQVKIRGFRIELGEIEVALLRHPEVEDAAVLALGDGPDRHLAAYVVGTRDAEALRAHLRGALPDYMVPGRFAFLEALPRTPNGKVDRRALARVDMAEPAADRVLLAPRTPTEEIVAGLWSELLVLDRIGVDEDLFGLGGDSLRATRFLSRVREAFGVELPLRVFFEARTVAALAELVDARLAGDREALAPSIRPVRRQGPIPLSRAQESLWFLDRLIPEPAVYNLPYAMRLHGALGPAELAALEAALSEIRRRHEVLRTVFLEIDGEPRQIVLPFVPAALPVIDLTTLPEAEREAAARRWLETEAVRPFDLELGPLMRASLLRLREDEHALFLNLHHIVADGWSMDVLTDELGALYPSLLRGLPSPLPELPVQFGDYALWQREWLADGTVAREADWWREELAGAPLLLDLPSDRPRPAVQSFRGSRLRAGLPAGLAAAVRDLGRAEGTTPFMTLLAAFQALLGRYTGQDDLLVGSPIANRVRHELEGLIGMFVNMLPLRGRLPGALSFRELLGGVRATALAAYARQDLPFDKLVEQLGIERGLSQNPIFQVVFAFQNPYLEALELPGLALAPVDVGAGLSMFDLYLTVWEVPDGLASALEYASDLFDEAAAERLLKAFRVLLGGLVAEPERPVWEVPLLEESERAQVVEAWNRTSTAYPREACIHELFEEQAAMRPEAPALRFGGRVMTYGELDARAEELAERLRAAGVGPEVPVGLYVERSFEVVVGILGVLKAGGAYVPLDPAYPAERLAFMVADAGVAVVVTGEGVPPARWPVGVSLHGTLESRSAVEEDRGGEDAPQRPRGARPQPATSPENLAYVMYTSGSTGRPKGVAVTHRNVVRLVRETGYARFEGEVFLLLAPVAFDASTLEIWGPLLNGGCLVVYPPGAVDLRELGTVLREEEVSTLWLTAGLFHQMVEEEGESLRGLRQVLAGGDVLSPAHVRKVLGEGLVLVNGYGPTEGTTFTCCHRMREAPEGTSVPIGRPIANTRVYLLGRGGMPVPVGFPGELCAGGDGLARGYWNQPERTAERFVPDPFGQGERLYRTGDLARYRASGEIEFLGRIDAQVKIRGYRIEPGEIEAALAGHPGVREAAVVVRAGGGDKVLVGCVVAGEPRPASSDLAAWLRERLPEPMVPSGFVFLEELPLTPNGKVDRRVLAALRPPETEEEYLPPQTPAEERLALLWSELLGRERVGRGDSFFALGGHSLLAARLVSRIRRDMGMELPLRAVFEAPTLAALAVRLADGPDEEPIHPRREGGLAPLSFSQEALWLLDRLNPGQTVYSMPFALRLRGALDPVALEAALGEIVRRHEALRTVFPEIGGEPRQKVEPFREWSLPVVETGDLARWLAEEAGRPFDLARGPLMRAALLRLGDEDFVLWLNLHHIVNDGASLELLARELGALYSGSALPDLPVQYGDYAHWQRQRLSGERLERQIAWWREELAGAPALLELPADRPRPPVQSFRGGQRRASWPAELAEAARELSRSTGATPFMTLLAAFHALLHRLTGQADALVGTPASNRNRPEVEGLIGFFVNTLVLRGRPGSGEVSFRELARQVRTAAVGAYAHQDLPFERLVEALQLGAQPGLRRRSSR